MDGEISFEPYIMHGAEYQLLADVAENTENTTVAIEDFYKIVEQQYQTQQACSAVEIFLLAAVFGAICARGLFRW